jgi:hypothetical protein
MLGAPVEGRGKQSLWHCHLGQSIEAAGELWESNAIL